MAYGIYSFIYVSYITWFTEMYYYPYQSQNIVYYVPL